MSWTGSRTYAVQRCTIAVGTSFCNDHVGEHALILVTERITPRLGRALAMLMPVSNGEAQTERLLLAVVQLVLL